MSTMDPERWQRLRPLLDQLLDLPDDERAAALDRLCAAEPDLRPDLEALLAADAAAERAGSDAALVRPVQGVARGWLDEGAARATAEAGGWLGRTLGPYRILRLLGEGGMGIVFEAEQREPRRVVALKLVRGGSFLDDSRLRLFRREIEALARLQHPSIAPIYGAGRTEDGQHYFAMERVHGQPLDAYLRERPSPAADAAERRWRIALFLEICDAIAYAHQRGVIHRDLKPSNVVVESPEESDSGSRRPRVKVLDFGLARITDGDVALSVRRSEPRAIEGTLPYMSPEQARGDALAIDLRSDVYSLGVLLYEMLTGTLPYELPRGSLHAALGAIGGTPPVRPSQRVPALRGDLEVIVLKALEKEPSARYGTVSALADDLRREREDQPIAARPPGASEQLRRFARRHRTAAVFSGALAAALLLGAAGTTVGMLRARAAERDARRHEAEARDEARTAESVSRFLVGLFEASDPDSAHPDAAAARRLLERGTRQLEGSLAGEPRVRARLYHTLGTVHRNLGQYSQARELLRRAIELRRETLGPQHLDVATSEYVMAGLLRRLGEFDEAEKRYRTALDIRLAALGPDHRDVAGSWMGLANVFLERGEYGKARPLYEKALASAERALGPDDPALTTYHFNLGLLTRNANELPAAVAHFERAIAIQRGLGRDPDPVLGDYRFALGGTYAKLGRLREALVEMRAGLALLERGYGPGHATVGESLTELAGVLLEAGEAGAARDTAVRAVSVMSKAVGESYWRTALARDQLGLCERELGRARVAVVHSERALHVLESSTGSDRRSIGRVVLHLAGHWERLGERARARALYERALPMLRETLGPEDPDTRLAAEGARRTG